VLRINGAESPELRAVAAIPVELAVFDRGTVETEALCPEGVSELSISATVEERTRKMQGAER
jgi:hypothetical protein